MLRLYVYSTKHASTKIASCSDIKKSQKAKARRLVAAVNEYCTGTDKLVVVAVGGVGKSETTFFCSTSRTGITIRRFTHVHRAPSQRGPEDCSSNFLISE